MYLCIWHEFSQNQKHLVIKKINKSSSLVITNSKLIFKSRMRLECTLVKMWLKYR